MNKRSCHFRSGLSQPLPCPRVWATLACLALLFLRIPPASGANVVNCGFEDADALDGIFDHTDTDPDWTEIDTNGAVWTGHSAYVNSNASQAHGGTQKAGLNAVGDTLEVDPAASGGVGTVSFYLRASAASASWNVTIQTDSGGGWTDRRIVSSSDIAYKITTATINLTGHVKVRWNMTDRTNGSCYLDDVTITDYAGDPSPAVASITRTSADPTTPGATVKYTVTFSENVSGVDAADFRVAQVSGSFLTSPTVVSVTKGATASLYTVAVNVGLMNAGDGAIRLDVIDNDSIVNGSGKTLGGSGAGNGDFKGGETYEIDATPPAIESVSPARDAKVSSLPTIAIVFDEEVTGVVPGDLTVQDANGTTAAAMASSTDNVTWIFSLPDLCDGTIAVRLDAGAIKDLVGLPLPKGDNWTYQKDSVNPASAVGPWTRY
jgi:hypothetical protein